MNFVRCRILPLGASPLCQLRRCTVTKHADETRFASPVKAAIFQATNEFADHEGRRPRILLVSMQKERSSSRSGDSLASSLAQLGFDVDICPNVGPAAIAREAVESDVHLVHLNVAEQGPMREGIADVATQVVKDLHLEGADDVPLCLLLPAVEEQEKARLIAAGISNIFTSETSTTDICEQYLRLLKN